MIFILLFKLMPCPIHWMVYKDWGLKKYTKLNTNFFTFLHSWVRDNQQAVIYFFSVCISKDWGLKKYTKLNTIFFLIKCTEIVIIFFTCILPIYMADIIFKDFFKNSLLENMTAVFLLTCQKSLRREISLIRHWNIDSLKQKIVFCVWHGPKKWSKYHLDTIQTTLSENNNY